MHRGPFFMGQTIGMAVNVISVSWLLFAIVFFSFPYQMPVTGMYCNLRSFLGVHMSIVLTIIQYRT